MFDLNAVNISGRIGQKPEIKQTASGSFYCRFTIANKVNAETTQWIPCEAWNDTAKFIQQYISKGDRITIEGNAMVEEYDWNGEKRKRNYIAVKQVHFEEAKKTETPPAAEANPPCVDMNDPDLPF